MKAYRLWVLLLCSMLSIGISAQDAHWSYDPYAYQYDMTAYVKMVDQAGHELSLNDYELAAFVGDECRGIAVSSESNGSEYGYLRIRSNTFGEEVSFKAYDKAKQREWVVGETMTFLSDGLQGLPSSPISLTVHVLYKVSFLIDDTVVDEQELEFGANITAPTVQEKEGHTFSGWSEIPATMPANDLTVTGTFSINTYKVFYKVDGEDYKTVEVTYGETIPEEVAPEKEGYTFSGWSEIPETMPANDLTVTGSFTINQYVVRFFIVYDGETILDQSQTLDYGSVITAPEVEEKEGTHFSWIPEVDETVPAHDVTYEGRYLVDTYLIYYKVDNEAYKTVELKYGEAIVLEEAPEKEGYTFSGWSEVPETMPANNITVTGTFTVNTYKVFYKVDGEDYKTVEVTYGETIPEEPAPEKEGFLFSGWSEIPETMPAQDITIEGTFTEDPTVGINSTGNGQGMMDNRIIYKLSGQRINVLQKGINIINGRKILVK